MRPSERIGRVISKVFTGLFIAGILAAWGCAWYEVPIVAGVISCALLGMYIGICVASIKEYYEDPQPWKKSNGNILWPIVKWLDRNYKEE